MARAQREKSKDVSVHSRAARRATSPSINVDKSILNTARAREDPAGHLLHHVNAGNGVSKKKNTKSMTRQQRLRMEKGMERAAQHLDKLSKKVEDSHSREKKVKTRNAPWEELNAKRLGSDTTAQLNVKVSQAGLSSGAEIHSGVENVTADAGLGEMQQAPEDSAEIDVVL